MTINNHFKELARVRMVETGEPYSVAARAIRGSLSFRLSQFSDVSTPIPLSAYRDSMFTPAVRGVPHLDCVIGVDETGSAVTMNNATSLFIGGRSGSGKSNMISSILTQLTHNNKPRDVQLWCIGKKESLFASGRNTSHVTRSVDSEYSVEDFMVASVGMLKDAVAEIRRRFVLLKESRSATILPESTSPHIFIVIDEVEAILKGSDKYYIASCINTIVRMGRAAGVFVIMTAQASKYSDELHDVILNNISLIVFRTNNDAQSRELLSESGMEKAPNYVGVLASGNDTVVFRSLNAIATEFAYYSR